MLASFPIPHHALGRSSQERSYSAHQRVAGLPPRERPRSRGGRSTGRPTRGGGGGGGGGVRKASISERWDRTFRRQAVAPSSQTRSSRRSGWRTSVRR